MRVAAQILGMSGMGQCSTCQEIAAYSSRGSSWPINMRFAPLIKSSGVLTVSRTCLSMRESLFYAYPVDTQDHYP